MTPTTPKPPLNDALYDVTWLPRLGDPVYGGHFPGAAIEASLRSNVSLAIPFEARDLSTGSLFIFRPRVRG